MRRRIGAIALLTLAFSSGVPMAQASYIEHFDYQPLGGVFACIRKIESGGNYWAVSKSGRYKTAYQFSPGLYRTYFHNTPIEDLSPRQIDSAAQDLYSRRGLSPWPKPRRKCK